MRIEDWEKLPGFVAAAIEQQGYGREDVAEVVFGETETRQLKVDVRVRPVAQTVDVEFVLAAEDGALKRRE